MDYYRERSNVGLIIAIVVVLLLLVGGGIATYFILKTPTPTAPTPTAPTPTPTAPTPTPTAPTPTPTAPTPTPTAPTPTPTPSTCDSTKANEFMYDWIVNKYWSFGPKEYHGCPSRGFKAPFQGYVNGSWVNCRSKQECYDTLKHAEHFKPEGARGVNMSDVERFVNY